MRQYCFKIDREMLYLRKEFDEIFDFSNLPDEATVLIVDWSDVKIG